MLTPLMPCYSARPEPTGIGNRRLAVLEQHHANPALLVCGLGITGSAVPELKRHHELTGAGVSRLHTDAYPARYVQQTGKH